MSKTQILPDHPLMTEPEVRALLDWFEEHGVDYPWGENPGPYRVWISEIMLQQTVVTAAIGHFTRWIELFPDIPALAASDEQTVLKAWEGLGYYSRARNILKGALYLTEVHGSSLPDSYEELIKVPGIGDYTARAVLSLAFGKPFPVLDANVRRIAQRLLAMENWSPALDKSLLEELSGAIPSDQPGFFNCALMQLGQQVCKVKNPLCLLCPFGERCKARAEGRQDEIPQKTKRKVKEKRSALILLLAENHILLLKREKGIGKGLWFIPSCAPEKESSLRAAFMPADVRILKKRNHLYTTWKESLEPYLYTLERKPVNFMSLPLGEEYSWVSLNDLENYPVPSVYRKILKEALSYNIH